MKSGIARPELDRTFSVAPMMDWTTRDYRAFARLVNVRAKAL